LKKGDKPQPRARIEKKFKECPPYGLKKVPKRPNHFFFPKLKIKAHKENKKGNLLKKYQN